MAEAAVEGRPLPVRFFCHKCNIEFDHVLQDFICPYCSGGFIEQLEAGEGEADVMAGRGPGPLGQPGPPGDRGTIDVTPLDDSDDLSQDIASFGDAFIMSGNQIRTVRSRNMSLGGAESLLQQIMLQLTGSGMAAGGAPPLLVFGGDPTASAEGLDAMVSQLLWQAETEGPPPLNAQAIDSLPEVTITNEQAAAKTQCSVCWELFIEDEKVRQLTCSHLYHQACIAPWLALHATCPICRQSLAQPESEVPQQNTGATSPSLATLLLRACRSTHPPPPNANATGATHQPQDPEAVTGSAPTTPTANLPPTTPSANPPQGPPNPFTAGPTVHSRIIGFVFPGPITSVVSLLRSMSSGPSSSARTEPRTQPPSGSYDMDMEFD